MSIMLLTANWHIHAVIIYFIKLNFCYIFSQCSLTHGLSSMHRSLIVIWIIILWGVIYQLVELVLHFLCLWLLSLWKVWIRVLLWCIRQTVSLVEHYILLFYYSWGIRLLLVIRIIVTIILLRLRLLTGVLLKHVVYVVHVFGVVWVLWMIVLVEGSFLIYINLNSIQIEESFVRR